MTLIFSADSSECEQRQSRSLEGTYGYEGGAAGMSHCKRAPMWICLTCGSLPAPLRRGLARTIRRPRCARHRYAARDRRRSAQLGSTRDR